MFQWSVVGLAMSFFSRVGFVTSSRSIRLRRLSIVFPNSILFKFLQCACKNEDFVGLYSGTLSEFLNSMDFNQLEPVL